MIKVDFNGLTDGQSVVNTSADPGSVAGKRFSWVLGERGFANGYGMQADTEQAMPGSTSSAKLSIRKGSDGDPGDIGKGMGAFGGGIDFGSNSVFSGEELWVGFWIFVPQDFEFTTNTGFLKFVRFDTRFNVGRIDNLIANGLYNGTSAASQIGWALVREGAGNDKSQSETTTLTQVRLNRAAWNWVEMYMKPYHDRNLSVRRVWINGQFATERVGSTNRWVDPNGTLRTQVISSGDLLLSRADDSITNMYLFTYWNGYAPKDQAVWLQKVIIEKNPGKVLASDSYGNKMMGPQ